MMQDMNKVMTEAMKNARKKKKGSPISHPSNSRTAAHENSYSKATNAKQKATHTEQ